MEEGGAVWPEDASPYLTPQTLGSSFRPLKVTSIGVVTSLSSTAQGGRDGCWRGAFDVQSIEARKRVWQNVSVAGLFGAVLDGVCVCVCV